MVLAQYSACRRECDAAVLGGPTNSGKTYFALKRLEQADAAKGGGLYCGPLRLLALEVYEQLNRNGASIPAVRPC